MNTNANRYMTGFVLIALGLVFLLHQTGYIHFDLGHLISTYWPLIIIYFSLTGIIFQKKVHDEWSGSYWWNMFGLGIGLYFLGRNLGWIDLNFRELLPYVIPAILIVLGLQMVFKPKHSRHSETAYSHKAESDWTGIGSEMKYSTHTSQDSFYDTSGSTINKSGFINEVYLGRTAWELKPTNVSHFIGDTVIDLTTAYIPFGETKINISAFIGDVLVLIPNDPELELFVSGSFFLGESTVLDKQESGLFKSFQTQTPNYDDGLKRVRIQMSAFIGDLHVQRVG